MNRFKFLIFMSLVLSLIALSWGVDQGWAQSQNSKGKAHQNQLKDAENEAAALRKSKGLMQHTTNEQRRAAAARNAARRAAAADQKAKGGQAK